MAVQDGVWRARLKDIPVRMSLHGRALVGAAVDIILPPMAFDSRQAATTMGLDPGAWSRIQFLEAPVCDGCGGAFDYDAGAFGHERCLVCQRSPYGFDRARAACVYDEASRPMILRFKHGDQQQFAPLFARWIARSAADLIVDADVIVPVPLHPVRLLSRRFNQAAEVARPLARLSGLDYLPDGLQRQTPTDSQGGKSARGRRLNVQKAFSVSAAGRRRIKGRRILLIDDVLTTGATAEACARALMTAGARAVDLAVIARVRTTREVPK